MILIRKVHARKWLPAALPPQNKPTGIEEKTCNPFLKAELEDKNLKVVVALGSLAHRAVLRCKEIKLVRHKFAHNIVHHPDDGLILINSYHCSR